MNLLLNVLIKGEISFSQKQVVITLVEKKGKDRTLLENWRPISLVNVDVKIMSKVIIPGLMVFIDFQKVFDSVEEYPKLCHK